MLGRLCWSKVGYSGDGPGRVGSCAARGKHGGSIVVEVYQGRSDKVGCLPPREAHEATIALWTSPVVNTVAEWARVGETDIHAGVAKSECAVEARAWWRASAGGNSINDLPYGDCGNMIRPEPFSSAALEHNVARGLARRAPRPLTRLALARCGIWVGEIFPCHILASAFLANLQVGVSLPRISERCLSTRLCGSNMQIMSLLSPASAFQTPLLHRTIFPALKFCFPASYGRCIRKAS